MPRDLQGVTRLWIVVLVALVLIYLWGKNFSAAGQTQRAFDHWIAQWIRPGQPHWAHRLADEIHEIFGPWLLIVLRWGVITALMVWKRWRHLAVFVATVVLVIILAQWFPTAGREGTGVVGHPSLAAAGLVVTLLGVVYGLTSAGPWRRAAQIATVLVCAVLAFVLLERGSNTPVELAIGFAGAMAIGSMGYRLFAPDRVFPVRYGHGRTAHLELTAVRLAALEERECLLRRSSSRPNGRVPRTEAKT